MEVKEVPTGSWNRTAVHHRCAIIPNAFVEFSDDAYCEPKPLPLWTRPCSACTFRNAIHVWSPPPTPGFLHGCSSRSGACPCRWIGLQDSLWGSPNQADRRVLQGEPTSLESGKNSHAQNSEVLSDKTH